MNSFERLYNTMEGKPVDRIPVVPIFMAWAPEYIGKTYGEFQSDYRVLTESLLRMRERFQIDQLTTLSDPYRETSDYGATIEFVPDGVCRCKGPLIVEPADVKKLRRMSIDETTRMMDRLKAVERFASECKGDVSILGWVEGPLAEFCTLRTLEAALMDLMTDPSLFHDVSAITMENAIDWAGAQINAGADMIGVGDAASSLVSLDTYREHIFPWQQQLFQGIHDAGGKVRLHICGNINHIIEDLAKTGADVIDIDWMVDLKRARQLVGPDITLFGQFDPASVLRLGTPEKVAAEARRNIADGGQRFGLMPGCEVPSGTPEENIAAFCPVEGCLIMDALTRSGETP